MTIGNRKSRGIAFTMTTSLDEPTGQVWRQAKVMGNISVVGLFRNKLSRYEKILDSVYQEKSTLYKSKLDLMIATAETSQLIQQESLSVGELKRILFELLRKRHPQDEALLDICNTMPFIELCMVIEKARSNIAFMDERV